MRLIDFHHYSRGGSTVGRRDVEVKYMFMELVALSPLRLQNCREKCIMLSVFTTYFLRIFGNSGVIVWIDKLLMMPRQLYFDKDFTEYHDGFEIS